MGLQHHDSVSGHAHGDGGVSPYLRTVLLLKTERKDLSILLVYTLLAGLLSLTVPLAAQALVNTIAAGVFLQPLVVLTVLLFVGLLFVGILRASQFYIVEVIQQRIFARTALVLAERIPAVAHQALMTDYPPELLNRFFDVIKVQKTLSKLLLDGPTAILQILVGLVLLAAYSPVLLGFDLFILAFVGFIALVLGRGGVSTSVQESVEKYRVAAWLEDLARCQVSLKVGGFAPNLFKHADQTVVDFLQARRAHFRVLFRQVFANSFFQAFCSAGILGIGGWLVIHKQLTLGQLVASELVILILLAALDKLVTLFQDWYDLLASIEKIALITDLPIERTQGQVLPEHPLGVHIQCQDIRFAYNPEKPVLKGLSLTLQPGETVSLVGSSGAGKSTLAAMFCGLIEPQSGFLTVNGVDLREVDLQSLRQAVSLVSDSTEIFEGTLEENIVAGRPSVTTEAVRWALDQVHLTSEISTWSAGLQTRLVSTGRNLSKGQVQRIMIARAIVGRPKLLILDEAFTGIDERTKMAIIDALLVTQNAWTVLDISHDRDLVLRANRIMVLEAGMIVESADPRELVQQAHSHFASLFPAIEPYRLMREQ